MKSVIKGLLAVVLSSLAVSLSGCTAREAPSARVVSIPAKHAPALEVSGGRYVAAGTKLSLRLITPVGTDTSGHGDVFTASVARAVYSVGGESLLVPAGAVVTGRVVESRGGPTPTLALQFETIETMHGILPIHGHLLSATTTIVETPSHRATAEPYSSEDSRVVAYSAAVGPWEPSSNEASATTMRHVRVLAGAEIHVELHSPLVIDIDQT